MLYVAVTSAFCQPVSAHARKIPNVNNNIQLVYNILKDIIDSKIPKPEFKELNTTSLNRQKPVPINCRLKSQKTEYDFK